MAGDDDDPDRAAILARRRRFVALAISGLATTGCKGSPPEVCLSIAAPEEGGDDPAIDEGHDAGSDANTPFVEDPGAPLEGGETGETGETGSEDEPPDVVPQVCLKKAAPRPCLRKRKPQPQPCLLLMIDDS